MTEIILKDESYKIVGLCMEVHAELDMGFKEIVYKDAMEYELIRNKILFRREKKYQIAYKGIILPHSYSADFIVYESIILEVKATSMIINSFVKQTVKYLKASGLQLGIIANFGENRLHQKEWYFNSCN